MTDIKRRSRFDPENEGFETKSLFEDFEEDFDTEARRAALQERPAARKRMTLAPQKTEKEDYGDFDKMEEEEEKPRAPLSVRMFTLLALLLLVFVLGYFGANKIIEWTDSKGTPKIQDIAGSPAATDIAQEDAREAKETIGEDIKTAQYSLYVPTGDDYTVRRLEITKGIKEQDMEKLLSVYFESLRETGMIADDVTILNIFVGGSTVYMNMSGSFASTLGRLDKRKATKLVSGMLHTLDKNFAIKRVRFYIDAKEPASREPIDISKIWELRS